MLCSLYFCKRLYYKVFMGGSSILVAQNTFFKIHSLEQTVENTNITHMWKTTPLRCSRDLVH